MVKKIILLLTLIFLVGCSNAHKKISEIISRDKVLEITIDSMDNFDLEEDSRIIFKLWGYDTEIADTKATLLKTYDYNLLKLPVTYGLDYKEKEWDKKINPRKTNFIGYYITIETYNKDGKKYKIDYLRTDSKYFPKIRSEIGRLGAKIYIKK